MSKRKNNKLKIFCCVDQFYRPFGQFLPMGGGGKSLYGLLSGVMEDMDIYVLCFNNVLPEGIYYKNGLNLHNLNHCVFPKFYQMTEWFKSKKQQKYAERIIEEIKPDFIIGQRYAIPSAVKLGYKSKIPTIVMIRSYENIYSSKLLMNSEKDVVINEKKIKKYLRYIRDICEYPFTRSVMQQNKKAIKRANAVVAVSRFVAKVVKESYGITPEVIYPCVDFNEYKVNEWNPQYITFIRPTVAKGVEIFSKIARKLNNKEFLCVGKASEKYEKKIRELSNVRYAGWIENMKSVYAKTKILIAPALWHEPLPRTVIEAMSNKIPCIVSNRGGLPEAVGDAGLIVENPSDVQDWINKISYLYENSDVYSDLSKRSFERAKLFNPEKQCEEFRQLLKQLTH